MNEENFKKILYLVLKVTIKNNGFLSQLEIFRDVRILMDKLFKLKEGDFNIKLGQGKSEDFKDNLNFILTILVELELYKQKMENKSFYFKWQGFQGFRKKYLLEYLSNNETNFEISDSIEHKIQIFTRLFLLEIFKNNGDKGINNNEIESIIKTCGLEYNQRNTEKIYWILKFIGFINPTKTTTQIFSLSNSTPTNKNEEILFKINPQLNEENLANDNDYAEEYSIVFIENILSKYDNVVEENENNTDKINNNFIGKNELNELENFKININRFNSENDEAGFAMLKGNNWCYYIKKLFCIIGRSPIKYGTHIAFLKDSLCQGSSELTIPTENYGQTTWHVDVDLGQNRKISKQHALICYNFQTCSFEIQNLSKKQSLKINGEEIKYGEEIPLTSKTLISIGNQEFYFLLPL
jgi:hypothetical protein